MAIATADMPADASVADTGDWAGAIRQRRKALLQRLGMGAASALIFSPLLGWSLSFAWVVGYFVVQMLDVWVFSPIVSGKAERLGGVAIPDDQQRAIVGQSRQVAVKLRMRHRFLLQLPERRGAFDEMDLGIEAIALGRAQRVPCKSASSRAEFDVCDRQRAIGADPHVGQPQPDQFAEHLADLGRGDEIAVGAQRVAARIVAGIRFGHEVRQADRPGAADQPAERLRQRRRSIAHAGAGWPAWLPTGGRVSARMTKNSPTRISGMVSHWPMLRPVERANSAS